MLDVVTVGGCAIDGVGQAIVLFVWCDWEHAFSARYMINMIPWLMVFLER